MKHIKIYEDFDLEKFLEDPNSEFHDDSNPEIEIGDWVTSYRGPGQLLSINNDIARVQLISGSSAIILVPFSALNKITKAEADQRISDRTLTLTLTPTLTLRLKLINEFQT